MFNAAARVPDHIWRILGVNVVLHRLATTDVVSLTRMYSKEFLKNAALPFLGNGANFEAVAAMALHNINVSDDRPRKFLVIKGVPGSGKSRLSYECLRMWDDPVRLQAVADAVGGQVRVVRLFLDFNNGGRYTDGLDDRVMNVNLGARLAAQALGIGLADVHALNGASLKGLTVAAVLDAVLQREEERFQRVTLAAAADGAGDGAPRRKTTFLLIIHLDEYQTYLSMLATHRAHEWGHSGGPHSAAVVQTAMLAFKTMLSALNDYARSSTVQERWRVILLPIVSGTPVLGVPMLATDKLKQRLLRPAMLDRLSAEKLVASVLTHEDPDARASPLSRLADDVMRELRRGAARVAIADTGFRPRLLVNLGHYARERVMELALRRRQADEAQAGAASLLSRVDWRAARDEVADIFRLSTGIVGDEQHALVRAALLQTAVRFDFRSGTGPKTLEEIAVAHAEAAGLVDLEAAEAKDYRTVSMPLMQVMIWGTADLLHPDVTDVRASWDWTYLEQLCGRLLTVRMNFLSFQDVALSSLLPGSLGYEATKALVVVAPARARVFLEQTKFIKNLIDIPERVIDVDATVEGENEYHSHKLDEGVFITCPGTAYVDLRVSLRLAADPAACVHVIIQAKHTSTNRTLSVKDVAEWHAAVKAATVQWRKGADRTVFVFVSNRPASGDAGQLAMPSFFRRERRDLLLFTSDQLPGLLTAALAQRGLLHPDNDGGEPLAATS